MSLDDRLAIAEDIISPHQMHGRLAIEAIREARAILKELEPKVCEKCGYADSAYVPSGIHVCGASP